MVGKMAQNEARPVRLCDCGQPVESLHFNAVLCPICKVQRKKARDAGRDKRVNRPYKKPGPKPTLVDPVEVSFKLSGADYDALYRLSAWRGDRSIRETMRQIVKAAVRASVRRMSEAA
jgi:hypothetical protein